VIERNTRRPEAYCQIGCNAVSRDFGHYSPCRAVGFVLPEKDLKVTDCDFDELFSVWHPSRFSVRVPLTRNRTHHQPSSPRPFDGSFEVEYRAVHRFGGERSATLPSRLADLEKLVEKRHLIAVEIAVARDKPGDPPASSTVTCTNSPSFRKIVHAGVFGVRTIGSLSLGGRSLFCALAPDTGEQCETGETPLQAGRGTAVCIGCNPKGNPTTQLRRHL